MDCSISKNPFLRLARLDLFSCYTESGLPFLPLPRALARVREAGKCVSCAFRKACSIGLPPVLFHLTWWCHSNSCWASLPTPVALAHNPVSHLAGTAFSSWVNSSYSFGRWFLQIYVNPEGLSHLLFPCSSRSRQIRMCVWGPQQHHGAGPSIWAFVTVHDWGSHAASLRLSRRGMLNSAAQNNSAFLIINT